MVRVVASPLVEVVFHGQHVIAPFSKAMFDLRVLTQAGQVVAVGDFMAGGVEEPQSRVECRADAASVNLHRESLPRFDMEFVEVIEQRLERRVDRSGQADSLGGSRSRVARRDGGGGEFIDQQDSQGRNPRGGGGAARKVREACWQGR